ncbi:Uncharacterised protein [uncultured archaeon]|nr:Uncharacterised protein [uncultured archaeon]
MATIFNTPQDVERAIAVIEWSRQYMEMNQAHISKIEYVQASLLLLRRAAGTTADLPEDRAQLVASTLKNCIKFHDLNSAEPIDPAWVSSLPALQGVRADWF